MLASKNELKKVDSRLEELEERVELQGVDHRMDLGRIIQLIENLLEGIKEVQEQREEGTTAIYN